MKRWLPPSRHDTQHVMPMGDIYPHRAHVDCWCRPDEVEVDLWVHPSFDKRETTIELGIVH